MSGGAIAYTRLGRPDIGLVSMSEVAETISLIRDRVDAHLIVDADTGYGNALNVERTVRTFDTAERNADLSVEELLRLFEMRALVHHALGDEASMRGDLRRLVAVRGSYQLSHLAPPRVSASNSAARPASTGKTRTMTAYQAGPMRRKSVARRQ